MVVPGGKYVFVDTINVVKDLILKNKDGEKVVFQLGMYNQGSNSSKTMMNIESGTLTINADSNENFVFSGSENPILFDKNNPKIANSENEKNAGVSKNGVFATVGSDAKLVVDHATFKESLNNGENSGAILVKRGGSLEINDGLISNNYHIGDVSAKGGAITSLGGNVTVNGGTFDGNFATDHGGAIFIDSIAKLTIKGGKFLNNLSGTSGGAVSIGGSGSKNIGTTLNVDGGIFEGNESMMGGAIFINSNEASRISAGEFRNNTANRGGAVYLDTDSNLQILNAIVEKNTASDSYEKENLEGLQSGSGGGLWYCPTGHGKINMSNGVAIFDNNASHEGRDLSSVIKDGVPKNSVYISNRILGGGYVSWYNDTVSNRYKDGDKPLSTNGIDRNAIAVLSMVDESSKELARKLATTIFEGNNASTGGAIATNGNLIFGEEYKEFSIKIRKEWSEKIKEEDRKPIEVALIVLKNDEDGNEKEYVVDKFKLSKDNGYTTTFKLPLEAKERIKYMVKELGDDYIVSYKHRKTCEVVSRVRVARSLSYLSAEGMTDGNTFSTEDISSACTVELLIINEPKPIKPEEPKVPEKPQDPNHENPSEENPNKDKNINQEKDKETDKEKNKDKTPVKNTNNKIPNKVKIPKTTFPEKLPKTSDMGLGIYILAMVMSVLVISAFRKRV